MYINGQTYEFDDSQWLGAGGLEWLKTHTPQGHLRSAWPCDAASTKKAQDPYCIAKPTSGIIVISGDLASAQAHRSSSSADILTFLARNLQMQQRSA